MARAAVALESPNPGASARPSRPQFRPRRLHALLIAIAIVAIWLVFVFARALGDVDHATARKQSIAAEAATLQARLDADHREQLIVQTDAFQAMQARAYGLGAPGEIVFSLPQDAPSPAPITPLGATTTTAAATAGYAAGRLAADPVRKLAARPAGASPPAAFRPLLHRPAPAHARRGASADRSTARPSRCRRSARRSGRTKP